MVHKIHRDPRAGRLIRELRTDLGLSPEALSYAVFRGGHGSLSARTIRRVESDGMVPRVRAQFALASFFGRSVTSIWPVPAVAATRKVAA
jgi:transcriptional regulator with XRE-family HTH domain